MRSSNVTSPRARERVMGADDIGELRREEGTRKGWAHMELAGKNTDGAANLRVELDEMPRNSADMSASYKFTKNGAVSYTASVGTRHEIDVARTLRDRSVAREE